MAALTLVCSSLSSTLLWYALHNHLLAVAVLNCRVILVNKAADDKLVADAGLPHPTCSLDNDLVVLALQSGGTAYKLMHCFSDVDVQLGRSLKERPPNACCKCGTLLSGHLPARVKVTFVATDHLQED